MVLADHAASVETSMPQILTPPPGPRAASLIERGAVVIPPSHTRSYARVAERAFGCIVTDMDGNQFLDPNAGIAVVASRHCHPAVVEAIQTQAAKLIQISATDFCYFNMVELAERSARLAQMAFEQGLLALTAGPNTIRLSPPLVLSEEQADFAAATLERCLTALEAEN